MQMQLGTILIVCLIPLAYLFFAFEDKFFEASSKHDSPATESQVAAKTDAPLSLEESANQMISRCENARRLMDAAIGDDAEGKEVSAFGKKFGLPAKIAGYRNILSLAPPEDTARLGQPSENFKLIVARPGERLAGGYAVESEFEYDPKSNILFVDKPDGYDPLWYGVIVAHEARHAYDVNLGIEKAGSVGKEWAQGELRAYTLEHRLLNLATKGVWLREVDLIARRLGKMSRSRNDLEFLSRNAQFERLSALFPKSRSDSEEAMRGASMILAVNFRYADLKKLGDEAKLLTILAAHSG